MQTRYLVKSTTLAIQVGVLRMENISTGVVTHITNDSLLLRLIVKATIGTLFWTVGVTVMLCVF